MGSGVAPLLWSPAMASGRRWPTGAKTRRGFLKTAPQIAVEVKLSPLGIESFEASEALFSGNADPRASALGRRDQAIDR